MHHCIEKMCDSYAYYVDLLEADTPINRAKVSLKLHELEYKVDVEKKVQEGIKNLYHLLERSTSTADRRRKAELLEKQLECTEKMALLNNAVKKYKDLYLGEEEDEDEDEEGQEEVKVVIDEKTEVEKVMEENEKEVARVPRGLPGARRPVTGKLQLKIVEAHELAHAPTRMFRDPHTAVMVKIDGNIQFRTRLSKNDKWTDSFEMHVDKATEVELLVYDQSGDRTLPIGLLWLKISDIAENLRKQKLELELHDSNWVSAEVAQQHNDADDNDDKEGGASHSSTKRKNTEEENIKKKAMDGGIAAWFDVEPLGRIYLEINFGKKPLIYFFSNNLKLTILLLFIVRENVKRRPMDKLGRAGAVRERKGEVHEMNGHQFVARRFYHIMKCALCGDFMAKLSFQCEGIKREAYENQIIFIE